MEEPLREPSPEEVIEREILGLIDDLYLNFGGPEYFDVLPQELQDEWYWVEQEARVGKNREVARDKLKSLMVKLRGGRE